MHYLFMIASAYDPILSERGLRTADCNTKHEATEFGSTCLGYQKDRNHLTVAETAEQNNSTGEFDSATRRF